MNKYKHALALYPYSGHTAAPMSIFPATGLEYIAASMRDSVDKVTLLDLRHERAYQDLTTLRKFIRDSVDPLCISIQWHSGFRRICDFIAQLPPEVCTVVGGYKATQEVEYLMTFPEWYPRLTSRSTLVFQTQSPYSPKLGGENMAVYHWDAVRAK